MSPQRAFRLSKTLAGAGVITLLSDRDLTFNGLDLLTVGLLITSLVLVVKAQGGTND